MLLSALIDPMALVLSLMMLKGFTTYLYNHRHMHSCVHMVSYCMPLRQSPAVIKKARIREAHAKHLILQDQIEFHTKHTQICNTHTHNTHSCRHTHTLKQLSVWLQPLFYKVFHSHTAHSEEDWCFTLHHTMQANRLHHIEIKIHRQQELKSCMTAFRNLN